ncbi:MAG TPA: NAD(P)-binding domain-containing protein [Candidatus Dormibacteraeota bacterium]|nr:NAD(P)-binding domain-containing protein [Candidatus Dormibacteraeota bacterium]
MERGPLPARIETLVVGGGQAGLVMSSLLSAAGREHLVLERRDRLGGGWQDRWDSFRLVSPNWVASFPGHAYDGDDPDGFMPRDEIAGRVARYAEVVRAPVRLSTEVTLLTPLAAGGFRAVANDGTIRAEAVVVATGGFHVPRVPAVAADLPPRVLQLHSHVYRTQRELPDGAVLVVGSGQSGVQLAEELHEAGRRVYLSVGTSPRMPRRYRGRDIFYWLVQQAVRGPALGVPPLSVDRLPDPRIRLIGNGHLSGHGGGHEVNLRRLAADGITLVGHVEGADGEVVRFARDLTKNLAWADTFFDERILPGFDLLIERGGYDAPPDDRRPFIHEPPEVDSLDLRAAGVSTIIWTSGYRLDHGWIDGLPRDAQGFPVHDRGVSPVPGLYFLGLPWQYTQGSATLMGVGADGRYLAGRMGLSLEALPA